VNEQTLPPQRAARQSSKLKENKDDRGRRLSRTLSDSSAQSIQYNTVQHNTVQRKSLSSSPQKDRLSQDTPEWKRRLLNGDVAYGETCDLFSPVGLENIFRPPEHPSLEERNIPSSRGTDMVMPSSPPPYPQTAQTGTDSNLEAIPQEDMGENGEKSNGTRPPRIVKYNMTEATLPEFSENDLSRSSSFRPNLVASRSAKESIATSDSKISPKTIPAKPVSPRLTQGLTPDAARIFSGQSDVRHEGLSPIFIARHNTTNGDIDYAALDISEREVQSRLKELSLQKSQQSQELGEEPQSSSQLGTLESEDFALNGHYISVQRGGHSDESFQKRMLSPSSIPHIDESALLQELSVEASTPKNTHLFGGNNVLHHPTQPAPPIGLQTPRLSPAKPGSNSRPSSASPLKLFGQHDTFTTEMLARRLSQFEQSFGGTLPRPAGADPVEVESTPAEMNQAYIAPSSPEKVAQRQNYTDLGRRINRFGEGGLDKFEFSEDISPDASGSFGDEDADNKLPVLDPTSQTNFKFHLAPSPTLRDVPVVRRRSKYSTSTITKQSTTVVRGLTRQRTISTSSDPIEVTKQIEPLNTPRRRNGDIDGKRLLKTPLKDPTPKRRRTLHKTDISHATLESDTLEPLVDIQEYMQSATSRKRRESKQHEFETAHPAVIATRQILRPRTPTPSQRSGRSRPTTAETDGEDLLSVEDREKLEQQEKIARIQAELDSGDVPMPFGKHMQNDSRKNSVTTQDFLDEAKAIMAGIRGKTKRMSGLASVEESESEHVLDNDAGDEWDGDEEDSYQESTQEPFSRPPSREGKPVIRMPQQQQDPALLSHLKQYEEGHSDMEEIMASSLRSMKLAQDAVDADAQLGFVKAATLNTPFVQSPMFHHNTQSDPPHIQITEYPELQRKRKHSFNSINSPGEDQHEGGYISQGSMASSSGPRTGETFPTTSSVGSASRKIIPPQNVSHLIPQQLAGMVFDRERNIWIKRKSVSSELGSPDLQSSDESEEDPFGDIPDLSVDETQELQRLKAVAARHKAEARVAQVQEFGTNKGHLYQNLKSIPEQNIHSSKRKNGLSSSESSKVTRFTSSMPLPDTQQTSYADPDKLAAAVQEAGAANPEDDEFTNSEADVSMDGEMSVIGDRLNNHSLGRRRRNVTISFSSPVASVIQDHDNSMQHDMADDEASRIDLEDDDIDQLFDDDSFIELPQNSQKKSSLRPSLRGSTRRFSLNGHAFNARPVSRIDEQEEEDSFGANFSEGGRNRSMSVIVTTPVAPPSSRHLSVGPPSSALRRAADGSLLNLTPLSDFTMHHRQEESFALEVSYIARERRKANSGNGRKTLSLSIKQLVEQITDVEPYEPFWEHMKQLELKGRRLDSLHMLNEFCGSLEELDASSNQIAQLDGTPSTVRHLRITHNVLSDLTSWGHLMNLQYLDLSNNNLTTLDSFRSLIHLRGLRADNNQIVSIEGIKRLDGLMNLRLRGNLLTEVDFDGANLPRLTDLDLKSNKIQRVKNLHHLPTLTSLNLDSNNLSTLPVPPSHSALKYLKISANELCSLDVSQHPSLRLLYLDNNSLSTINGLLKTKHLDTLSLRSQSVPLDLSFLDTAFELRKLFLSGNFLPSFTPAIDFLNLQYLELANCGLVTLPPEFGLMMANVRVLNLNFNALQDLRPLLGIVRLKKLFVAGNRILRLRRTASVVDQFCALSTLDLRSNPLTLGFYPLITEKRVVVHKGDGASGASIGDGEEDEIFMLGTADEKSDERYAARLDMATRMRRRVYEMLVLGGSGRLKRLDGLAVKKGELARDEVWMQLVMAGVVVDGGTGEFEDNGGFATEKENVIDVKEVPQEDTARWEAEDSFA
jgi:Leucine-rich repeat (LRR) protein